MGAEMSNKKDDEMERAFKICLENKGDTLTKDQLYNYLCALGLTPTQKEVDALPDAADLATAKAKYEELYSEDRAFSEEQVAGWFSTWDPDGTGKIPISKLEGPVDGVLPLSKDEISQLKSDRANEIDANGMWDYNAYLQFMVMNQNMKTGTSTF